MQIMCSYWSVAFSPGTMEPITSPHQMPMLQRPANDKEAEANAESLQWLGLHEFVLPEGASISVWRLPAVLGITGCLKLAAMIGAIVWVSFAGADLMVVDGYRTALPTRPTFYVIAIPALLGAGVSAKCLDLVFRLVRVGCRRNRMAAKP